jgi:hypothetical protein
VEGLAIDSPLVSGMKNQTKKNMENAKEQKIKYVP